MQGVRNRTARDGAVVSKKKCLNPKPKGMKAGMDDSACLPLVYSFNLLVSRFLMVLKFWEIQSGKCFAARLENFKLHKRHALCAGTFVQSFWGYPLATLLNPSALIPNMRRKVFETSPPGTKGFFCIHARSCGCSFGGTETTNWKWDCYSVAVFKVRYICIYIYTYI